MRRSHSVPELDAEPRRPHRLRQLWRQACAHWRLFYVVPPIFVSSILIGAFYLLRSNGVYGGYDGLRGEPSWPWSEAFLLLAYSFVHLSL
jgi:hypothetical protein